MDCKDLMVGDWFKAVDYNSPFRITAIYDDLVQTQADYQSEIDGNWYSEAEIKDLVPIELTEEILVKNGFVKTWNGDWQLKEYATIIISKDYYVKIFERSIRIDYIHELQHMLHAACVEKELVIV